MDIFSKLADATANRIAAGVCGLVLQKIETALLCSRAGEAARLEQQLAGYEDSHPTAANLLQSEFAELVGDDPGVVCLSIARSLLADGYEVNTAAMRAEPGLVHPNGDGDRLHHPWKATANRMNGSRRCCPDSF